MFRNFLSLLFLVSSITLFAQNSSKVGYADIGYIVASLPQFKDAQSQYSDAEKKYTAELQQKGESFRKEYQTYAANAATMSDSARANTEKHLQEVQASIREYQANSQQSLENFQKLLLAPVYLGVNAAIKEIAAANGYVVVLTAKIGDGNLILYHDARFDISDLVIKSLVDAAKEPPAQTKPQPKKKN